MRDIILSIHPKYSQYILRGRKTVEFRRRNIGRKHRFFERVYIYETAPTCAIVGRFDVKFSFYQETNVLWEKYRREGCLEKREFKKYFEGVDKGLVIGIENVQKIQPVLHWDVIEMAMPNGWYPPVSYRYVDDRMQRLLQAALENTEKYAP